MKLTDDLLLKGLLNKFNTELGTFLTTYKLINNKDNRLGDSINLNNIRAQKFFNAYYPSSDGMPTAIQTVSKSMEILFELLDAKFYFELSDNMLPLAESDEADDEKQKLNEFSSCLHNLVVLWAQIINRSERLVKQPSAFIIAGRELWAKPQNREEEGPTQGRQMVLR